MTPQEARKKFDEFCAKKMAKVAGAKIPGYKATGFETRSLMQAQLGALRDEWVERLYDGLFFQSPVRADRPVVNGVFVQDKNGNTDTKSGNPGDLGGGETDLHLIYEGLSRVDVDAVLAGAGTIRGWGGFFSVWHPELVQLRKERGKPRHPEQIIVSGSGNLDLANELIFNLPREEHIPVIVITTSAGAEQLYQNGITRKDAPFVAYINTGKTLNMMRALQILKVDFDINSISAVGGRTMMTELFDRGLVDDFYLTTSALETGLPNTPYYVSQKSPKLALVVRKKGVGPEEGVVFEHFVVKK